MNKHMIETLERRQLLAAVMQVAYVPNFPFDPVTEVAVADGTTASSSDLGTYFGALPYPITHVFSVRNTGTDPLDMFGSPRVVINDTQGTGANNDFLVVRQPIEFVAPGGVTYFYVTYIPTTPGIRREAEVSIVSDDLGSNPYTFTVYGGSGTNVMPDLYDSPTEDERADGDGDIPAQRWFDASVTPTIARTVSTDGVWKQHTIHKANDIDWSTFTLAQDSYVLVRTTVAQGDTRMYIFDSKGTMRGYDNDSGEGYASAYMWRLEAGTYYVRVDEFGQNATIPAYGLQVIAKTTPIMPADLGVFLSRAYREIPAAGQNCTLVIPVFEVRNGDGRLVNADQTPRITVTRTDTNQTIVKSGIMNWMATGRYDYMTPLGIAGATYKYTITYSVGGVPKTFENTVKARQLVRDFALVVNGTQGGDMISVDIVPGIGPSYRVTYNNAVMYFPLADVDRVHVVAGRGADAVHIGAGIVKTIVDAGREDDSITLDTNSPTTLKGGLGHDTISGGSGNDYIEGGEFSALNAGDDVIFGNAGNDYIKGGYGADVIDGGAGNDTLFGDADNDSLVGDEGNDALYGAAGDDTLDGGTGNDTLDSGTGYDTVFARDGVVDLVYGNEAVDVLLIDSIAGGDAVDDILFSDDSVIA